MVSRICRRWKAALKAWIKLCLTSGIVFGFCCLACLVLGHQPSNFPMYRRQMEQLLKIQQHQQPAILNMTDLQSFAEDSPQKPYTQNGTTPGSSRNDFGHTQMSTPLKEASSFDLSQSLAVTPRGPATPTIATPRTGIRMDPGLSPLQEGGSPDL